MTRARQIQSDMLCNVTDTIAARVLCVDINMRVFYLFCQVSSLKNEIASLTLLVEQREAENQRLQLNVANLQRDLREVEDEKRRLQEDSTRNDEVLNS